MLGDTQHRDQIKETYEYDSWQRAEPREARSLPLLPMTELPLEFVNKEIIANGYIDNYGGTGGILVSVWIRQLTSPEEAHEALIDYLLKTMAPRLPLGREKGIELGDISIADNLDPHLSLVFVRNEIFARVHSVGTETYPVLEFAQIVDNLLR